MISGRSYTHPAYTKLIQDLISGHPGVIGNIGKTKNNDDCFRKQLNCNALRGMPPTRRWLS